MNNIRRSIWNSVWDSTHCVIRRSIDEFVSTSISILVMNNSNKMSVRYYVNNILRYKK